MADSREVDSGRAKTFESNRVLSGWKEIAAYMGRGVRTVQRWEKLGLPVRRPNAHLRSAVLASTEEIDSWISGCRNGRESNPASAADCNEDRMRAELDQLRLEVETLRRELDLIKRQSRHVQQPAGKQAQAQQHSA
ncbi:MAG: hypothetical protein ACRD3E_03460 [Terriglobales bacterium]